MKDLYHRNRPWLRSVTALVALVSMTHGATAQEPNAGLTAKDLIGSWRMVDATVRGVPSETHDGSVTIKHITPTAFLWIGYHADTREMFRAGGGTWKIDNGMYVETFRYGMQTGFREKSYGKVTPIHARIDGDTFTQIIDLPDGGEFIEVWKRMEVGEDVDVDLRLLPGRGGDRD